MKVFFHVKNSGNILKKVDTYQSVLCAFWGSDIMILLGLEFHSFILNVFEDIFIVFHEIAVHTFQASTIWCLSFLTM